jgi:hypothetical protein
MSRDEVLSRITNGAPGLYRIGVLNSLYDLHMSILSVELQTDQ